MNTRKHSTTSRNKLRKHIGWDDDVTVTESLSNYWWWVINRACFRGKLPKPEDITVRRLHGEWGHCYGSNGDDVELTINNSISKKKLFIETLAHEMVHQWQWVNLGRSDHGASFQKWKDYFKKNFGILI